MARRDPEGLMLMVASRTAIRESRDRITKTKTALLRVDRHLVVAREAIVSRSPDS